MDSTLTANPAANHEAYQQNVRTHLCERLDRCSVYANTLSYVVFMVLTIIVLKNNFDIICQDSIIAWMITMMVHWTLDFVALMYLLLTRNPDIVDFEQSYKSRIIRLILILINYGIWIWGVVILAAESNCRDKVPHVYNLILAYIIFAGITLLAPLLTCCLLVICLPIHLFRMMPHDVDTGLKPEQIDTIPLGTFVNDGIIVNGTHYPLDLDHSVCAICLDAYQSDVSVRQFGCGHHLHQTCGDEWLSTANRCPFCNAPVCDVTNEAETLL